MNFLAGFLLLWTPEEQAFWLLCFLVEDVLPDHFGRNMIGSMIDQKVLIHYMQVRPSQYCATLTHNVAESASATSRPLNVMPLSILGLDDCLALLSIC